MPVLPVPTASAFAVGGPVSRRFGGPARPSWIGGVGGTQETGTEGLTFAKQEVRRNERDWFIAQMVDDRFEISCGPLNLGEAIHQFRLWPAVRRSGSS
ncbi:Imm53 family immunity protein [Actinoplanes sp. NBRC 101535]|uniref:Imm53 family immunity protein n=1 Tax=Actinoplanes sp. NBRC 101535 TaxID=3032196 RepID=UPI00255467D5|nr:Imm53 family immunity protein [Actinoplanes sp. NBRC 101535]